MTSLQIDGKSLMFFFSSQIFPFPFQMQMFLRILISTFPKITEIMTQNVKLRIESRKTSRNALTFKSNIFFDGLFLLLRDDSRPCIFTVRFIGSTDVLERP